MQEFFKPTSLVIDKSVRGLCLKPYPGHPKGCPNFNKKDGCPPQAKMIGDIIDLDKPTYVIYNQYDFGKHLAKMRANNPNWSQRQLECCLYWQGSARKQLKEKIAKVKSKYPQLEINMCPEACGVNITETMRSLGIELEWFPKNYAYQVAVAGTKKETYG